MHRKTLIALLGAMIIAAMAAGSAIAASAGPSVHVQIKSLTKTLRSVTVRGQTGWITKDGTPRGKCSADTAAGALGAATHGDWSGKYYSQYKDLLITSILGVKPRGNDYWGFYVNGKLASKGACDTPLRKGETLLFKVVK